jgi:hypothetical protein
VLFYLFRVLQCDLMKFEELEYIWKYDSELIINGILCSINKPEGNVCGKWDVEWSRCGLWTEEKKDKPQTGWQILYVRFGKFHFECDATPGLCPRVICLLCLVVRWLHAEELFSIKSPHDKHCNLTQVRSKAFVKTPRSVHWWLPRLLSAMPLSVILVGISQPFFVNGHRCLSLRRRTPVAWNYASCIGWLTDWQNIPSHVWSGSNQYKFFDTF